MKRFSSVALALCGALSLSAFAQNESPWFDIASTSKFKWEGKRGSGTMTSVDGKKNAAYLYVYQKTDLKNDKIILRNMFVTPRDCQRGYGLAHHNFLNGEFDAQDNFVRNGPTVADALGTVACDSLDASNDVTSPTADSVRWSNAINSKDGQKSYHLLINSARKTTYSKQAAISVLLREENKKENTHLYYEYVVPRSHCQRGHGKSYFLDFSGKLDFDADFAREGSSINSGISDVVCTLL